MAKAVWNGAVLAESDRTVLSKAITIFRRIRCIPSIFVRAIRTRFAPGRELRTIMTSK